MSRRLARLIDTALNLYAPTIHARSAAAHTTITGDADLLADIEADCEVWDPDELWAAMQRHPAGTRRTQQPVGAGAAPGSDGPTSTELSLAVTIANVLRACDTPWPTTTAGIVTRELLHHYTIQPKHQ